MTKSFPHTLIMDLLDLEQTKNLCEIYEKLYEGLTGEYYEIVLNLSNFNVCIRIIVSMNQLCLSRFEPYPV